MKFLGINTSGKTIDVVIFADGKSFVYSEDGFKKAAPVVMQLVDKAFCDSKVLPSQLDFVACCIGPGSFTGIRVGVSAARALCHVWNKNCLPVTSLQIMSYIDKDTKADVAAVCDAGNGFCYYAAFDKQKNYTILSACEKSEIVKDRLPQGIKIICESGLEHNFDNFEIYSSSAQALTKAVCSICLTNSPIEFGKVEPLYIRQPQAELK